MSNLDMHAKEIENAFADVVSAWRVYKFVFEKWPFGIVFLSADGTYLQVNNEFCRILQRLQIDIVGHKWTEFTHPDDLEGDLTRIEQNRVIPPETERTYEATKYFVSPTGERIATHIWVLVLGDPEDQVKWVCMVQRAKLDNGT